MNLLEYRSFARGVDWTEAFRAAIDALRRIGGGTLEVPAGEFFTHSIQLYSDMTLSLDSGCVVRFFQEPDGYPSIRLEFEGIAGKAAMPLIYAEGARNVRVTGFGTLDGNGSLWWKAVREKNLDRQRPFLVCFHNCEHVVLENVTLLNSPSWTVHPLYCDDVVIRGVTIRNPWDSPNTDGINPNASRNVRILDCLIDVGDDCIAIKAGTENTPHPRPCENILIANCHMLNGHGGVVIGSEMSGDVRSVQVTGCIFEGTDRGVRVKTRRKRGGRVENLSFSHILMRGVMCPFVFNMYYFCGKDGKLPYVKDKNPRPMDKDTPGIFDVRISDVTATDATACAGFVYGLPEMPVTRLSMRDVTVTMRPGKPDKPAMMEGLSDMEARGFFLRNTRDMSFERVRVVGAQGEAVDADESVTWV